MTYQIYEPLYAYHYLKRPYELIAEGGARGGRSRTTSTRTASACPTRPTPSRLPRACTTSRSNRASGLRRIRRWPRDEQGKLRYHAMTREQLGDKRSPLEFEHQGTRELTAEDYEYALKRHATPRIETPIYGIFSEYVIGLKEYRKLIAEENKKLLAGLPRGPSRQAFSRLPQVAACEGVKAIDKQTLRIRIKGKYPQWKYWLAMTFTAPLPWEADAFYAQPGMADNSLSLNQWPVGTGTVHDDRVRAGPAAS